MKLPATFLIALLALATGLASAQGPLNFTWTQPGDFTDVTTDGRGNVFVLHGNYAYENVPPILVKRGLFGNEIWSVDLSPHQVQFAHQVESLPGGDVIVAGRDAFGGGRGWLLRVRSADGAVVWVTPTNPVLHLAQPRTLIHTLVYSGAVGRYVIRAYDFTGKQRWEHPLSVSTYDGESTHGPLFSIGPQGHLWTAQTLAGPVVQVRQLNPATGTLLNESTVENAVANGLLALSAGAAVSDRAVKLTRLSGRGAVQWTVRDVPSERFPLGLDGYGGETLAEDPATGDIYWGRTSGNGLIEHADGSVNGFDVVNLSPSGRIKWTHRYMTQQIAAARPEMRFDALGRLVVLSMGSDERQGDDTDTQSCLFCLTREGTRYAESRALPSGVLGLDLNLGLFPLTRYWGLNPAGTAYEGFVTQQQPLVPRGPIITAPPKLRSLNGVHELVPEAIGGRGTRSWQWYRNDVPIPAPEGTAKNLRLSTIRGTAPRDAYAVRVSDSSGHGSISATVQP